MTEDLHTEWIKKEKKKISLVSPDIIPVNPTLGLYFKVNGIEIPEKIFKEEFDAISTAYFSVIQKLKLHNS